MRNTLLTLFLAVIVAAGTGHAQEAEERQTANTLKAPAGAGAKASLADLSWLSGHWTGTGLGGVSEEAWSGPASGAMMGMYRLVTGGKVVFYEFLTLVEENGSLALKLKHFNPDLTGWEEKDRFVTFRLAKLTPTEAYFGGADVQAGQQRSAGDLPRAARRRRRRSRGGVPDGAAIKKKAGGRETAGHELNTN